MEEAQESRKPIGEDADEGDGDAVLPAKAAIAVGSCVNGLIALSVQSQLRQLLIRVTDKTKKKARKVGEWLASRSGAARLAASANALSSV
jgi:hypothetical protein